MPVKEVVNHFRASLGEMGPYCNLCGQPRAGVSANCNLFDYLLVERCREKCVGG